MGEYEERVAGAAAELQAQQDADAAAGKVEEAPTLDLAAEARAKALMDPKNQYTNEQIAHELTARGEVSRDMQKEFDEFQKQRQEDVMLKSELIGIGKDHLLPEDVKERLAQDAPPDPSTYPEQNLDAKPFNPVIDEKTGEQLLDEASPHFVEFRQLHDALTPEQDALTEALLERYPQLFTFVATAEDRTEAALAMYQIFTTFEQHNAEVRETGIGEPWEDYDFFEMLKKVRPLEDWNYSLFPEEK